jgi:tetratricopeptide (TPR) repeat protein
LNSLKRNTSLPIAFVCLVTSFFSATAPLALGLEASSSNDTSRIAKGFQHLRDLQMDKAIAVFADLIANNAKFQNDLNRRKASAQLYALVGQALIFDENELPAEQCFYIATRLDPTNKLYKAYRADCLNRMWKIAEAERILATLDPQPGDSLKIYEMTTVPAMREMNYAKVLSILEKGLATSGGGSDRARTYVILARMELREGLSESASRYYLKASEATKSPYLAKIFAALSRLCDEKRSEARALYQEAGKINPDDPGWLYGLSITTDKNSPRRESLHSIEKAARCQRFSVLILNRLAMNLDGLKQTPDAQKCLDYILKIRPWSHDPHISKGTLYRNAHDYASAEKEFRAGIALNPYAPHTYNELATMYLESGKKADALKVYEEAAKICPSTTIFLPYGMLVLSDASYEKAEPLFREAIKHCTNPDSGNLIVKNDLARAHAGLGTCLYKKNDIPGALEQAKFFNKYKFVPVLGVFLSLIKLRPARIDFEVLGTDRTPELLAAEHVALADMLFETRHIPDCIKEYRLAIANNPSDVDLHSYLMCALSEQNDWIGTAKEDLDLSRQLVNKVPVQVDKFVKNFQHKN